MNWTVSSALKMSSRISNFAPCAMPKFFEIDRSRLLSGGFAGEEPRRFVALAARLRRREARRVGELLVRIAAPTASRIAGQGDRARSGLPSVPVRFAAPMPGIEKLTVYGRPLVHR